MLKTQTFLNKQLQNKKFAVQGLQIVPIKYEIHTVSYMQPGE